jgi:HAD superfamily hydrolase (TIGR01450 family)
MPDLKSSQRPASGSVCQHGTVCPVASGAWILDLDGVVWLAGKPIPGSADAVKLLRDAGVRVVFATNNAAPTVGKLLEDLDRAGIPAGADDLLTSAQAAASMLESGSTAVACAAEGVIEALQEKQVRVAPEGPVDAVVVGLTRRFDFELLAVASAAVRSGGRLIGTNEDATFPTPDGLLPGAGSILAAVATASQTTPEIAGKPHSPLVSLIHRRVEKVSFVVGDRPSTDGLLARRLSVPFGLVRTGVTKDGQEVTEVEPDEDAPDLRALVERVLAPSS